jgi:uncharacterized protein DUF5670
MLLTIPVILFCLWGLGLVTDNTGAGLIHILPMLAIAMLLVRLIERRQADSVSEAPAKANNSRNNVIHLHEKL